MRAGDVVGTEVLGADHAYASWIAEAGWHGALEHQAVEFVSWPYEWPFSMLKDAALLQLRLVETSIRHGWILKDATPFNIQWQGVRRRSSMCLRLFHGVATTGAATGSSARLL